MKTKQKVVCGLTACAIGLASFSGFKYFTSDADLIKNNKYISKVSYELDVDLQIMHNFSCELNSNLTNNLIRLKPNDDKNIYVLVNENLDDQVKNNIDKSLSELNSAFNLINDSYNFVKIDKKNYTDQNKTSISFQYENLEGPYGIAVQKIENKSKDIFNNFHNNYYIKSATIYLDKQCFDNFSDSSQLFVIKHELLHTLGFGDTYQGFKDETSLMNLDLRKMTTHLSPNDLKMLYAAYGNKHINQDGSYNQEKMDKIKELMDEYQNIYYKNLMNTVKNKIYTNFEKINSEDLVNLKFVKKDVQVSINNNQFEYKKGDYIKTGKALVADDYIILPDIKLGDYWTNSQKNDFLIVVKENNKLKCYNLDIKFLLFEDEIKQLPKALTK